MKKYNYAFKDEWVEHMDEVPDGCFYRVTEVDTEIERLKSELAEAKGRHGRLAKQIDKQTFKETKIRQQLAEAKRANLRQRVEDVSYTWLSPDGIYINAFGDGDKYAELLMNVFNIEDISCIEMEDLLCDLHTKYEGNYKGILVDELVAMLIEQGVEG